ncbi:hypothetical protein DSJ01_08100 [Mycobacterium tuberculosis]|nr:hypothetical protein DSJ01_08100 [Mycobacterium tuberculosis]
MTPGRRRRHCHTAPRRGHPGARRTRRVRRAWRPAVRPNRHGWRVAVAGRLAASAALASSQTSRTPWCRSLPLNWRR